LALFDSARIRPLQYNQTQAEHEWENFRMDMLVCPHCKSHRVVSSNVPRDVVVVMSCPSCHELSVLFRKKMIPLDRKVLEKGSMDERKDHLAHVIAEFLESGMLSFEEVTEKPDGESGFEPLDSIEADGGLNLPEEEDAFEAPISQEEFDKFVRIDLKCLDNAAYFHRHFG
jgi:uncharacterized protein YbaR (Trm112 family)